MNVSFIVKFNQGTVPRTATATAAATEENTKPMVVENLMFCRLKAHEYIQVVWTRLTFLGSENGWSPEPLSMVKLSMMMLLILRILKSFKRT